MMSSLVKRLRNLNELHREITSVEPRTIYAEAADRIEELEARLAAVGELPGKWRELASYHSSGEKKDMIEDFADQLKQALEEPHEIS